MPNKFSSFSPSGRKDLLEKLTKSDFMVEDIKQRVGTRHTELQKQLRDCEDSLLIHKTQNKTTETTLRVKLDELSFAVKPDFTGQINELTTQFETLQKDILNKEALKKEMEIAESNFSAELVKILESNSAETTEEKEAYEKAFREAYSEQTKKELEIKSLTKTIYDLKAIKDTCPTCGQKLPGAVKPDTSSHEAQLETLKAELQEIIKKVSDINTKHSDYQKQIKDKYENGIVSLKKEITKAKTKKEELQKEISNLTYLQNNTRDQLNKLNYEKDN
jgi:DNA repair exonuclease SbcCD ATPase subunit